MHPNGVVELLNSNESQTFKVNEAIKIFLKFSLNLILILALISSPCYLCVHLQEVVMFLKQGKLCWLKPLLNINLYLPNIFKMVAKFLNPPIYFCKGYKNFATLLSSNFRNPPSSFARVAKFCNPISKALHILLFSSSSPEALPFQQRSHSPN